MKRIGLIISVLSCCLQLSAVNYCATKSWGYAGTSVTGGGSAIPTLVTTEKELTTALGKGNNVIIITQNITVTSHISSSKSNMTIMALPGKKLISQQQNASNSGILYLKGNNLLLRNLTFEGPGAYDCDGWDNLCLDKATNVWVDHCDFQDGCDGNFDIKSTADNITVTWCRFRYLKEPKAGGKETDDHRFTNLIGSNESDKPSDGQYNITYGFCWWDEGCKERMTRCRNCLLHFLNCYWNSSVANYYVGPQNAACYFEGCTFAGKANTTKLIFKSYGGTNACKFVNCAGNTPSNSGSVSAPSYSYDQLSASAAKTMVTNSTCGAGATLQVTTSGAVYSTCDGAAPTFYTVTWDATTNSGSCATTSTQIIAGNEIGTLPTATRDGYTFDGWFTEASGGTKISTSTKPSGNVKYFAQFTENQSGGGGGSSDLTWNFSTNDFNSITTLTSSTTINGLTITANSSNSVIREDNNKTIAGYSFTKRVKTGGGGNSNYRSFNFAVTGPCTIEIFITSSSTTAGNERVLNIYSGSYGGTPIKTLDVGLSPDKLSYNYTGSATTIHMGSASGGINLYAINVVYSGGSEPPTPEESPDLSSPENASQTVFEGNAIEPIVFEASGTAVSISVSGLPAGLTSSVNGLKLTISGTPTASGSYTVTAKNSEGESETDGGYITVQESQVIDGNTTDIVTSNTWWNISDNDFNTLGTITSETAVRQLHILADVDYYLTVDGSNKTIDGYSFTNRLKYGGEGSADARLLWFDVNGDCTIDIYLMSSKDGTTRTMNVATGEFGNVVATLSAGSTIAKQTYSYTGNAAKILLYPSGGGVNVYGIKLTYPGSTPTYTITWKNHDGTQLEKDENVEEGATPTYDGATPTKAADAQYTYTFNSWNPTVVAATADATYKATFSSTKRSYTITWVVDGNSTSDQVEYGQTPSYNNGATPTKAEDAQYTYTFKEWNPAVVSVTGAATYTAVFEAVEKTATGLENTENAESAVKVVRDNKVYILRGEHMYDVIGRRIK